MAEFVESLNGKYITAEDVTSTSDIEFIGMETGHVAGNQSSWVVAATLLPVTAYGTYRV